MRQAIVISFLVVLAACSSAPDGGPPVAPPPAANADAAAGSDDAPLDAGAMDAATSAFTFVGSAVESCPYNATTCKSWPAPEAGTVTKYTSQEVFAGKVLERSFHVFVPKGIAGASASPLLMMLHGGFGSGGRGVASVWTQIAGADPLGVPWTPNTETCRALPVTPENDVLSFRTATGETCTPPTERAVSSRPFIVVFPDGLADPGKADFRHWEDGRLPSPGFDTPGPNRDDVGFLDHVFDVLLKAGGVDAAQLYVTGLSNGGMMTQRLASSMASHPRLRSVAAFGAFVSDVPKGLTPLAPITVPFGLALFHGTGIDTASCGATKCATTVSGDGYCPFGVAGETYNDVLSGPDTITGWRASLAMGGQAAATTSASVGFYTKRETSTFAGGVVELESWVTEGGGHTELSSRQDFFCLLYTSRCV